MDRGEEGIIATIKNCEKYGFDITGTNLTDDEQKRVFFKELSGIKVAFINYTYGTNAFAHRRFISDNKKYMESVITQSKNFNEIEIDFEKTDRKIIYATDYEMNLTLDIDKKLLSGNSKVKIKNNTNDETDYIILRNYSANALKNKDNSFLSNFKDESGNTLDSLVEDDESIIKVEL